MIIKQDFLTHPNCFETSRQGNKIDTIVLHSMDGFYQGTIDWFKNPQTVVSAHYLISKDGQLLQMLKDEWVGYHVGIYEINLKSIGIEMEDEKKREEWVYPQAEIKSLHLLVDHLCAKYKIPKDKDHILLHKNLSPDRTDPVGKFDIKWVLV